MRKMLTVLCLVFAATALAGTAWAVPYLQVFSPEENVYYDGATWQIPYLSYGLWIIGANLPIYDVKVAFRVPEEENGTIRVTPLGGTAVTLHEGLSINDPFQSGEHAPFFWELGTPIMGDGNKVPPGGVFPSSYYQLYIGDFGTSQTVLNYTPDEHDFGSTAPGEIKAFQVDVSGYSAVDIIAFDHYIKSEKNGKSKQDDPQYDKTPYSHDGSSAGTVVPEPSTLLLLGSGLLALGGRLRRSGR